MTRAGRRRSRLVLGRIICLGLLIGGWAVIGARPARAATNDSPPTVAVTMRVPATPVAPGTAADVAIDITNRGTLPCALPILPDASIDIMSVHRDGEAVASTFNVSNYFSGLGTALVSALRVVQPGQTISIPLTARAYGPSAVGIATVTALPPDSGAGVFYPTATPGRYDITARYHVPAVPGLAGRACRDDSPTVVASFVVGARHQRSALVLWLAFGTTFAVLCAIAVVAVRRRRSRAVLAAVLVLLTITLVTASNPRRAEADVITTDGPDADFAPEVSRCLGLYNAPGGDPAGILPTLQAPGYPVRITEVHDPGHKGDHPNTAPLAGLGASRAGPTDANPKGSTVIKFDPWANITTGGASWDSCAALYHELVHAYDNLKQFDGQAKCAGTPIQINEVRATFAENDYRAAQGGPKRGTYGGTPLPTSLADCDTDGQLAERTPGGKCDGAPVGGCGRDDLNPGSGGGEGAGGGGGAGDSGGSAGTSGFESSAGGGESADDQAGTPSSGDTSSPGTNTATDSEADAPAQGSDVQPSEDVAALPSLPSTADLSDSGLTLPTAPSPADDSGSDAGCATGDACGSGDGDPHMRSFDGQRFDLQTVGEYVLAQHADGFAVQARFAAFPGLDDVSIITAVAMSVADHRVGFAVGPTAVIASVDGQPVATQTGRRSLPGGGTIERRHGALAGTHGYTVRWPDSTTLWVDPVGHWGLRVQLQPAAELRGALHGLLGDGDGNPDNDLRSRDGHLLEKPSPRDLIKQFADSWRLTAAESLFQYGPGQSTATFTDTSFPKRTRSVDDLPKAQRQAATALCHAVGVIDDALVRDCAFDAAVTGQPSFAVSERATQLAVNASMPRTAQPTTTTTTSTTQPTQGPLDPCVLFTIDDARRLIGATATQTPDLRPAARQRAAPQCEYGSGPGAPSGHIYIYVVGPADLPNGSAASDIAGQPGTKVTVRGHPGVQIAPWNTRLILDASHEIGVSVWPAEIEAAALDLVASRF